MHLQKRSRSTGPSRNEKRKAKKSDKEEVTVAIVNIANHRLRNAPGKLLQFETSRNTHQKAQRNLEQVRQNAREGILALRRKLLSEKISIRFSSRNVERTKIHKPMSISGRNPNQWEKQKIPKYTIVFPKMCRMEFRFARHGACK